MTNEEINRYIYVEIMGREEGKPEVCSICGVTHESQQRAFDLLGLQFPDYTSDESPRRLLNEPFERLMQELGEGAFGQLLVQSDAFNSFTANGVGLGIWMTADAETLARFCVEAHKAAAA